MPGKKPKEPNPQSTSVIHHAKYVIHLLRRGLGAVLPKRRWLKRLAVSLIILFGLALGSMYAVARWYIWSERNIPLTMGVTFIPDYASYLGLNPQQTMSALINNMHVKQFRLVSYWSDGEPSKGQYDFSQLDWEFAQADAAHATVSLAIGLRQPRWPECHAPSWIDTSQSAGNWYPQLVSYISAVINRYKKNSALQSYQLENEYFNTFGQCPSANRSQLIDEFKRVKQLDPHHPVIISRSNNYGGLPLGQPTPDEFGVSVYRRVWSPWIGRYMQYPFPAWYYAFLAGAQKIITGKDSVLHELQAEAWLPNGQSILASSLSEQNKSFNAARLKDTIELGRATGMKTIDLWGVEYWYYRLTVLHDLSVWNTARQAFVTQLQK